MGLYNSAIWTHNTIRRKYEVSFCPPLTSSAHDWESLSLVDTLMSKNTQIKNTHTHPGENKFNLKAQKIKQPRLNEAINLMKQSFNKVKVRICIHIHTHSHKADTSNIYTPAKQDREHRHT